MMVSDEEKRWLVVGIAMNKVAAPVLRDYIKQGMDTHYTNLDIYCSGLTTPCMLKTLTYHHVSTNPTFKHLKFQNVNNNLHLHGKHKNFYNYNINSSVDLAKLFLPDYLAEFSAFDESLDMSAILRLLGFNNPAPIFPSPNASISIQLSADDVRENVRNKWGHCNVTDWTEVLFNGCFSMLETLVRSLGLTGDVEKTTLDQLSDWQTKGCQLCMGHSVDQNLLSLVQQDVEDVSQKIKKTEAKQTAIHKSLAQLRTEQTEMQDIVTSVQDQQCSTEVQLEEHEEQLEAVLEWKEQQVKESKEILEKLVAVEKTLSEELLIQVKGAEKGLAETNDKVEQLEQEFAKTDDKVEHLEQEFAKTDDKVGQLGQEFAKTDDRLEQLEQDFAKADDKVGQLEQEFGKTDDRVEHLEQGFAKTDDRVEQLEQEFAKTDDKVGQLEQEFAKTDDRVEQLEQEFAKTDDKVVQLEQEFAKTDDRVEQLEQEYARVEKDVSETSDKVKRLEHEVRSQRMKESKSEAPCVDTFDVKTLQRKLGEHYLKTAKVPTTVWSSVHRLDLEQIYTRLSWVKNEQTPAGSSQKELSHYSELFTVKNKARVAPKRILVQGETGIGKTTFVKKLLVDWLSLDDAKMQEEEERKGAPKKFNSDQYVTADNEEWSEDDEDMANVSEGGAYLEEAKMDEERKDALRRKFELVVSINLKEVSKCQTLREVIRCSRLFPGDDENSVDDLLGYVRNNQEKVLIVFDGYDEYRTGIEAEEKYGSRSNSPIYEIFHGGILRDCTVLVTTRSSRADEIRGLADIGAEITGFNMSDREDFMRKMLESQTQVNGLLNFLRKSNMVDLARVPLLNLFFCLLWKKEKENLMARTKSKTKLFRAIVKHILQHSHRKHSPSRISKLKEENYKEILAEIGRVALAGLLKGDLMFEYDQLPEKVRHEETIIVGLFQLSEYGPSLEPKEMVSFMHKSIQEYLAAWYITFRCIPEGNLGGLDQRTCTLEDCKALENVFQFVCGLSDDGAMAVFQHLKSVRISNPTLDLSKSKPYVENEIDTPLCSVTDQFRRFSNLVYDSFREVHSKAELLSQFFDCTGGIVLVTSDRPLYELTPEVSFPLKPGQNCVFLFSDISFDDGGVIYKSLEVLNCLQMPLTMPDCSKFLTVGDLVKDVKEFFSSLFCGLFSSVLCFRDGKFHFYITKLFLFSDSFDGLLMESSTDPAVVTSLCPEQSCLKFLSSLRVFNLIDQTVKTLGAVIQDCEHLNSIETGKSGDSVCDLLEQVPNPSKCSLMIGCSNVRSFVVAHLTSAGAVHLASLLPRFTLITLELDLTDCSSEAADNLVTSITHKTLERLVLSGINLTLAAALALGRSLPEMLSLQVLELIGIDGSSLQTEEIKVLFGGFNKTLPLSKLTLSGFSVRGCLAPLTESFCFFPNLTKIMLEKLNMDGDDQCGLLESLTFIRHWTVLNIQGKQRGQARCFTTKDKQLHLEGLTLTPAEIAALGRSLPEMSSLLEFELTGVDGSILQANETEVLFGGFYKTFPLRKISLIGFCVTGCIAPLMKSLRFLPNLRELKLEKLNMDEHDQCRLLESLRSISYVTQLKIQSKPLGHADHCKRGFTLTSHGFPHITSRSLNLDGISLTPATVAALGQSLPEMSSLRSLSLTAAKDGSILQANDLDALFGRFNNTLPLYELTFRDFSIRGSIGALTNSFCFFPNLIELYLGGFNVDEHNLCCLLDSLRFVPRLQELIVWGEPVSYPNCSAAKVNTVVGFAHKYLKELVLSGMILTPVAAAALGRLLPEMWALEELRLSGGHGSILQAEEMEALFGGFNKAMPLRRLSFGAFRVRCLAPLTKRLRFLPNLRDLYLGGYNGEFNMNEHNLCGLLESLKYIPFLRTLSVKGKPLSQEHCCTAEVNTTAGITHKNLEQLNLDGISLTPALVTVLGQSLPEMPSLQVLELSAVDGSIVQADEMERLFGGFNKTLPLYKLTFRGFEMRGCLAPLTKSLCFFPNLKELYLGRQSNVDEHDVCSLLENLRFMPNLKGLRVRAENLSQVGCYTTDKYGSFSHQGNDKLNLDGISLTPAVAAALGLSLPEMSSLQELELTGGYGSILQAEEMEALFGGYYRTMPLTKLTFSGFSVTGCLDPLTKSLRVFPYLRELTLERLNIDEHDQCVLLENFGVFRDLTTLSVRRSYRDSFSFHYHISELNTFTLGSRQVDKRLDLDGVSLTPIVAAALGQLLPEMSSLQTLELADRHGSILRAEQMKTLELFDRHGSTLRAEEMKALFGGFNRTLPVYNVTFSGFSVRGCLAPFTNMLQFFPNLRILILENLDMDDHDFCSLLNAHWRTTEVNTMASIPHKTLEKLVLSGMSLTPAAAAALGRSLPEMSSLLELELTGVDGSILKAKDMEALFGGFKETMPLSELTFSGFSVKGCLAPLAKSLQFFPNLMHLNLEKLNMDQHDLSDLLACFQFFPRLSTLNLSHNPLGNAVRSIVPHVRNLQKLRHLWIDRAGPEEDLKYVQDTVQEALPELLNNSQCHVM